MRQITVWLLVSFVVITFALQSSRVPIKPAGISERFTMFKSMFPTKKEKDKVDKNDYKTSNTDEQKDINKKASSQVQAVCPSDCKPPTAEYGNCTVMPDGKHNCPWECPKEGNCTYDNDCLACTPWVVFPSVEL